MADYDIIIAGGGLAGACAALVLSEEQRVLLLEADEPASGASGAAAGLVNPFMARRARPTWRLEEALEALHDLLARANASHLFRAKGVLRPARSEKQAGFFQGATETHPEYASWLDAEAAAERFPSVQAPEGALWIPPGGAVDLPAVVDAILLAAERKGASICTGARVTGWNETRESILVKVEKEGESRTWEAGRVVLALGQGFPAFPELKALGLRGVKGQTVRVRRPAGLDGLPPLSGYGYIVPDSDTLIVGSSYEHDFEDLAPSPEQTKRILQKAARMVPALSGAEVLEEKAGVRVMPEGSHLPLVGPLPGHERTWVFTALGSRGLLTAPLLARELPEYFREPTSIPAEVQLPS